jgi:acetylglutamate kinase
MTVVESQLGRKPLAVVKFGGNAVLDDRVLGMLVADSITLIKEGVNLVLVHGGGTSVNDALKALGIETKKIAGLRVTDRQTLAVAVKTFAHLNERIVSQFLSLGQPALGFSSACAIPFDCVKLHMPDPEAPGKELELGFVGEIRRVKTNLVLPWLERGFLPVIPPVGIAASDKNGYGNERQFYNINADHAALALAQELKADKLIYLTDVPGVLKDIKDTSSKISHLTCEVAEDYINAGIIAGGMLPKIRSCMQAIENGVESICILNSFTSNALLRGYHDPKLGTLITA